MADKKTGLANLVRKTSQDLRHKQSGDEGAIPKIFNVLDYIEQPWGLNMRLFPAQRFIVKLYYNIPLDTTLPDNPNHRIRIPDMRGFLVGTTTKPKILYEFTELEYLKFLHEESRCNIGEQDHERRELVLSIGRRSGKSTLAGVFASYEVYRLLNLQNPQAYYGLPNGNRIQIISIATDKDQAGILFNEVTSHLAKCDYFKKYIVNNTLSHVNFRTPYEIDKFGPIHRQDNGKFTSFNGKASLKVTFKSCVAKGLRGAGNIMIILDEVAHFIDKGNSSADEIYAAIQPSAAAFSRKDPESGRPIVDAVTGEEAPVESRIILISSPLGKSGKFYQQYDTAMRGGPGAKNLLAIQAPTWEINPTVPGHYYQERFHADPRVFVVEHGAEFSDQVTGWVERESDLQACINPGLRPKRQAPPRHPHYMGIDVGLVNDGTSISITHPEGDKIIQDYHEAWYARTPWRDTNPHLEGQFSVDYAKHLANVERLDFDEIANWIEALTKRFHIAEGLFDQHNGIVLEQALFKKGLKQFQSRLFTRPENSQMWQAFKEFMFDERIELYDYPIPERAGENGKHSPLISELLSLQANMVSKNVILVAKAENKVGAQDDMSDALCRSMWLSIQAIRNRKVTSYGTPYRPHVAPSMTPQRYQMSRARHHGFNDRSLIGRRIIRPR